MGSRCRAWRRSAETAIREAPLPVRRHVAGVHRGRSASPASPASRRDRAARRLRPRPHRRRRTQRAAPARVRGREPQVVTFVDHSRPTDANGTYAGAPDRTLPVLVLYPAIGTRRRRGRSRRRKPARQRRAVPAGRVLARVHRERPGLRRGAAPAASRRTATSSPRPRSRSRTAPAPGGPRLVDYLNQPADVSFVITKMLAVNRGHGALGRPDGSEGDRRDGPLARRDHDARRHRTTGVASTGGSRPRCRSRGSSCRSAIGDLGLAGRAAAAHPR